MKITKLILWISALVLIVALGFSVIYVAVGRKGVTGESVASKQVKNSQKFTDGLPQEAYFKYEAKISEEGKYRVTFKPALKTDTFVLGSEVYDSDGKLIGAAILFSDEESKADYKFSEGTCSFYFRYITSEQDFKDFIEEYNVKLGDMTPKEALKKVDFSEFKDNGSVSVSVKVNLSKAGSSIGYTDLAVLTGISVALLSVLIVLGALYKQEKPAEQEVYDGTAPEVPEIPVPQPAVKPAVSQAAYSYAVAAQQYAVPAIWVCPACGINTNTGRFCGRCGTPAPLYQVPSYQAPVYQIPAYTVPVQQYQVPVTYQMPVQQVQPVQPVQYTQPVFAPVPAQAPAQVPAEPAYTQAVYVQAPMPDYRAKPKKPEPAPADPEFVEGLKNRIPAVGAKYAAFCVVFLLIQLGGAVLLSLMAPDFVKQYKTSLSFGLVVLSVDIIGFPFIWLLMKGIPKTKIEQHKLSFSQWFTFLCISEALILAGSMVGNTIHTLLTQPFTGNSLNNATSLMQNSNVVVRTLVVGIGAPVFEELIFRKVLIDRTIKYGEYVSIVLSGIMFGLLHGNFSQFFFAAMIGMLFAYIYIRTGRVRYTIYLHMAINLSSALVLQTLLIELLKARDDGNMRSPLILVYSLIALAWAGGVFAIGIIGIVKFIKSLKRKKLALNMKKGEPSHKEVRKMLISNKAIWLYIAMTILLFLDSYLPNIIVFFMNK